MDSKLHIMKSWDGNKPENNTARFLLSLGEICENIGWGRGCVYVCVCVCVCVCLSVSLCVCPQGEGTQAAKDDNYNVLTFQGKQSPPAPEKTYDHISDAKI